MLQYNIIKCINIKDMLLSILFVICINNIFGSVYAMTNFVEQFPSYMQQQISISESILWKRILYAGILAPITEEIVFRGLVLNRIKNWISIWPSIFISSAIFGILHLNIPQGLYGFFLGVVCAWLYIRYSNIWIPIAGHAAANLFGIVILGELPKALGINGVNSMFLLTISILVTLVCIRILVKSNKQRL